MSRKTKSEAEETQESPKKAPNLDRAHELWGIIFLALGTLTLISLISHCVNTTDNVLGPYCGTQLALGLRQLFGLVPSFFIPLLLLLLGWFELADPTRKRELLIYSSIITVEVCLLLAIGKIPIQNYDSNVVGLLLAQVLQTVFGPHQLGPYFITLLLILITIIITFEITIRPLILAAGSHTGNFFLTMWQSLRAPFSKTPVQEPDPATEPAVNKPKKVRTAATGPLDNPSTALELIASPELAPMRETNAIAPPREPQTDEERAEVERLSELAAFRARKNTPITIMTPENSELPDENSEELLEEATIDTPLANLHADEHEPEYCKVPEEEIAPVKVSTKPYIIPPSETLPDPPAYLNFIDRESIERHSQILEKTLMNFGVEGKVVNVAPGPVVTRYEIELAPGIKVSRVVSLQDDISMAVGGQRIRIQAPIPGKAAIGIELPNENRQTVYFKHILLSEAFTKAKAKLPIVVGRNIAGLPYVGDITKMPHLLIAGQTGAGKSVCINSFICSMLMTRTPDELRLIMIDPKKVELSYYQGIPHLLAPVVTESKEAVKALQWGQMEMDRRYRLLARAGARNIESFNLKITTGAITDPEILADSEHKALPFIVIIVDELADLMLTASKDVEASIQRIAQLARAVGIHLIVATQRPSVDIITGPIKANLTSRIAFRTIQSTDSRTILGHVGSEKLLGQGDMLFLRSGAPDIERYHGAFLSEEDVEEVVRFIKKQEYGIAKIKSFNDEVADDPGSSGSSSMRDDDDDRDTLFAEAARTIVGIGQGSTSLLQRRMKIGFARAGRLMDELERAGIVGPSEGSKVREVRVSPIDLEELLRGL